MTKLSSLLGGALARRTTGLPIIESGTLPEILSKLSSSPELADSWHAQIYTIAIPFLLWDLRRNAEMHKIALPPQLAISKSDSRYLAWRAEAPALATVGMLRGRRSKASQGGNRGEGRGPFGGRADGDLRIAEGWRVRRRRPGALGVLLGRGGVGCFRWRRCAGARGWPRSKGGKRG
jgi:hypothetical protein